MRNPAKKPRLRCEFASMGHCVRSILAYRSAAVVHTHLGDRIFACGVAASVGLVVYAAIADGLVAAGTLAAALAAALLLIRNPFAARPRPVVLFTNGAQILEVNPPAMVPIDHEAIVQDEVTRARATIPKPKPHSADLRDQALVKIGVQPEHVEKWLALVPEYEAALREWLAQFERWRARRHEWVEFGLILSNEYGSAPLTRPRIQIEFPQTGETFATGPSPPWPPDRLHFSMADLMGNVTPRDPHQRRVLERQGEQPPAVEPAPPGCLIGPTGGPEVAEFHLDALTHGLEARTHRPLKLRCGQGEHVLRYEVHADNLPRPATGELRICVPTRPAGEGHAMNTLTAAVEGEGFRVGGKGLAFGEPDY